MTSNFRIAIVAFRSLPVVESSYSGNFGGLETSAWLTAKGLASRPHTEISLIVRYPLPVRRFKKDSVNIKIRCKPIEIARESLKGGIQVVKRFPYLKVIRWDNSYFWKIPILAITKTLSRNRAHEIRFEDFYTKLKLDCILLFGTNPITATAISSLKSSDTKTILSIQSNSDVDERFSCDDSFVNEYGERAEVVRFVFAEADTIIVQNNFQQRQLKKFFNRESFVLGNPFDLENWDQQRQESTFPESGYVLWVGRPDRFHKRPHLLLEVARACPDIPFLMILNAGDADIRQEIESQKTNNIQILDSVPFAQMPARFEKASLFAFTGSQQHEGFPNVLLQAAATEKAIVAYDFVPQAIADSGGAVVSGSASQMSDEIKRLYDNPGLAKEFGQHGRKYVENNGDLAAYSQKLMEIIRKDN